MKPDSYGNCVICHSNLLVPRVVGGKQIMHFTPDFDQTEFVISNKSKMVVCMCRHCKSKKDLSNPDIQKEVMESVKLGWDGESGNEKRAPMDYHNLSILFHSEGIDDYVIHNRLKDLEK